MKVAKIDDDVKKSVLYHDSNEISFIRLTSSTADEGLGAQLFFVLALALNEFNGFAEVLGGAKLEFSGSGSS